MKQKELKFDIEKINDMKKSLSDSADDLNNWCGRRTFRRSGYSIWKSRRRGRQN